MKNKKPNAALMWKQFEDLAPRLRLSIAERTVYSYLLRHSRLEGRRRIEFSLRELARGVCVSLGAARPAVRRLISRGVLLLVERSKVGHVAEVRTPEEILMVESGQVRSRPPCGTRTSDLEEPDFLNHPARRRTIHARERGRCFYCLGNVTVHTRCLDHVVPRVELVDKIRIAIWSRAEYLCSLHRKRRLTSDELACRLRALDALAAGKLRPSLLPHSNAQATTANPHKRDSSTAQTDTFAGANAEEKASVCSARNDNLTLCAPCPLRL